MRRLRATLSLAAVAALTSIPAALATGATPAPPGVTTAPATAVSGSGATLNGSVNPNGQQTSYAFQWGPTAGYGHETPLASAGAGTTASAEQATLSGLASGTSYHFRIIAMSASGTSVGSDQTFATTGTAPASSPAPAATTGSASSVGQSGATLQGTVDPTGQSTTYYFEYGPTANYGFETAPQDAGSGATAVSVTRNVTGLGSSTTYHYRLVAVSAGGTALGTDHTFTTTTPPAVSTGAASSVQSYAMVLNGTVNPQGQATTYWFQYGTSTAYGQQTGPAGAGSGSSPVSVHSYIGGLTTNTTYHYRLVAQSAGGTSYGTDQTATPGQPGSRVVLMAHMGFVSPGRAVGVGVGCFGGTTRCAGHVTISHNGTVIGQRDFNIAPNSGGFQDMELSLRGARMLTANRVFHLLPVTVTATGPGGQKTSTVIHLARWVWH
jgi:hypothetical protein